MGASEDYREIRAMRVEGKRGEGERGRGMGSGLGEWVGCK